MWKNGRSTRWNSQPEHPLIKFYTWKKVKKLKTWTQDTPSTSFTTLLSFIGLCWLLNHAPAPAGSVSSVHCYSALFTTYFVSRCSTENRCLLVLPAEGIQMPKYISRCLTRISNARGYNFRWVPALKNLICYYKGECFVPWWMPVTSSVSADGNLPSCPKADMMYFDRGR